MAATDTRPAAAVAWTENGPQRTAVGPDDQRKERRPDGGTGGEGGHSRAGEAR